MTVDELKTLLGVEFNYQLAEKIGKSKSWVSKYSEEIPKQTLSHILFVNDISKKELEQFKNPT